MSKASELNQMRKSTGELYVTGQFEDIPDITCNIQEYYDNILSEETIKNAVAEYTKDIDDAFSVFSKRTGLTKKDYIFLFTATALQCIRQYCLTPFQKRLDNEKAAKQTAGHGEEHSNRSHRYYNPSLEEILSNPVPFDANVGSGGALKGGGQLGHRATALGHDPIIGLVIGTANIATSTLTNYKFESYHIQTSLSGIDSFKNKAQTSLVLSKTMEKLLNGGMEGKKIVATSLVKEIIHLKSDIYTKNSLPLPIISSFDPKLASELAQYGMDMANVVTIGKQAALSIFINSIIGMLHRLLFASDAENDQRLYEVRTRKIILYSNVLATSSNLLYTCFSKNISKLDVGGLLVTLSRIFFDTRFINKLKYEFVDETVSRKYAEEYNKIAKYYGD